MTQSDYRIERDSMGELRVPSDALYGAQTQRAVDNFPVSGIRLPQRFIQAGVLIKRAAAATNRELGLLDPAIADAIIEASSQLLDAIPMEQFPVDVFQTGSGTSSNMNLNEVIAALASRSGTPVHPNDHVNMCQSSNDVIPGAIHLSAALALEQQLLPSLKQLSDRIKQRAEALDGVCKTGRTHLMDAMPIRMDQELNAWASQVDQDIERIRECRRRVWQLPLGGTAVGTGINAHPEFSRRILQRLSQDTGLALTAKPSLMEGLSSQDSAVELSGQLRVTAISLHKIANDLRWMNSGPLAGLGEIELTALQPGSSIMPGKVNPVIPEAVMMVSAQVIGNDASIAMAGQSGNFQLNTMLPLIAYNLLQSIELLANAAKLLAEKAVAGFKVQEEKLKQRLALNPILVTALNPLVGYEKAAAICKQAYREGRAVLDVAEEQTALSRGELEKLLDPVLLTRGGIHGEPEKKK
ncbi:class II fumarate hydratase [Sedimenticola hydrogenitrophicus]|uniref:class II fumarate hydratase n=1 Tax=Sedimenticola hydrogenitrophicus TaxID=2967975 RepID=UPI0023B12563|nr:class II fumarate hydratase [Sedimenticola hydrogenitrophicus]